VTARYGFTVATSPDGIRIRRGLLSTVAETIPFRRVQAVRLVQPLLWRPFGWCRLVVHVAGVAGRDSGPKAGGLTKALLPVGYMNEAQHLVGLVLGYDMPELTKPPKRARVKAPLSYHFLAAGHNQVMAVTDALTGKQAARVVIGKGADAAAYDPDLALAFSSNGLDGTLTVIHQESPDEYRVLATVTTQVSARTMVLDPATHKIYLATAKLGATPPATEDQPHPHPGIVPNSVAILVAQPK